MRVVDELDDVLLDMLFSAKQRHLSPYKPRTRTSAPDSVAFVTGLRRSLIDPDASNDPDTHRYNNIYVEVAFSRKQIKLKKVCFSFAVFFCNLPTLHVPCLSIISHSKKRHFFPAKNGPYQRG